MMVTLKIGSKHYRNPEPGPWASKRSALTGRNLEKDQAPVDGQHGKERAGQRGGPKERVRSEVDYPMFAASFTFDLLLYPSH